jgi:hypothetical protein
MTRKLKTLGVALVAVFALTAVMASAASAANYTASSYGEKGTTGTGISVKGNDVFTTEGGTVKCASHFEGTLTEASETLTVTPKYTECEAFGFLSATVNMNGCAYVFQAPSGSGDAYSAAVKVECPAEKVITITASTCEATVGAQSPSGSTAITNNTAAGDVSVKANVTGINYTVTKDGFLCPFNGTGAKTGGTYTQNEAITFDSATANIHIG